MNRLAMLELAVGFLVFCITLTAALQLGFDGASVIAGMVSILLTGWVMLMTNMLGNYVKRRR